jgi:hypothetical protein
MMRPFPHTASGKPASKGRWTSYRKSMIEHAGIALFVFGNKKDGSGKLIEFDGLREEFDLCVASGVVPIPIGATGYMAETLWREVDGRFAHFFPRRTLRFGRVSRQSATTQQHHLS